MTPHPRFDLRLVVVSAVTHYRHGGVVHAYTPYARELALWAQLVRELVVAAPVTDAPPPDDCAPIAAANLRLRPQRIRAGTGAAARARRTLELPRVGWSLARALRGADAVHVRCPSHLGGLAAALAPLVAVRAAATGRPRLVAKYAGQWSAYPGEPTAYRLQRRLLASAWWRGPVTVYGPRADDPPHVVPFFSAALDAAQLAEAGRIAAARTAPAAPLRVLSVGRLVAPKRVDRLLDALHAARAQGVAVAATIVGDGPERAALHARAARLGLLDVVRFAGALPPDSLLERYRAHDVLVLLSESEGWPKVVAEAMACGLACIGLDRGMLPTMLADGRGLVVPPDDTPAVAAALSVLARDPQRCHAIGARAAAWAGRYSLEALGEAIGDLLASAWRLPDPAPRGDTRMPGAAPRLTTTALAREER